MEAPMSSVPFAGVVRERSQHWLHICMACHKRTRRPQLKMTPSDSTSWIQISNRYLRSGNGSGGSGSMHWGYSEQGRQKVSA